MTSSTGRPVRSATPITSGACISSGVSACAQATSRGAPASSKRSATRARCSRQSTSPISGSTATSCANGASAAAIRVLQPARAGVGEVPARGGLDEPVDAGHQLRRDLARDVAAEALDLVPARVRADHLARDPERADDVGDLGPALRGELGDERRPERVHDLVGVDHRDQLAPQRVLARAGGRSARRRGRGSTRAGRARATGPRRSRRRAGRGRSGAWRTRAGARAPGARARGRPGAAPPSPRPSAAPRRRGRAARSPSSAAIRSS